MAKIIIVDENDNQIGVKAREDVTDADCYRVSAIWITKPGGDILMAQRALTKKHDPGRWGPAIAGTVEEGEDYVTNAIKEALEEIGLMVNPKKLEKGPLLKIKRENEKYFFCQWFFYVTDMPTDVLELQKDEVAQVRWLPSDVVRKMVASEPNLLVKSTPQWIHEVLRSVDSA